MDFTAQHSERQGSRPAAVAGLFYPDEPEVLAETVDRLLAAGGPAVERQPKALIAPHAGYVYSGPVAARAYAALRGWDIRRVVVICPSHFEPFRGASLFSGREYLTPLGPVPVDAELRDRLVRRDPELRVGDQGHRVQYGRRSEHALEVQLPFLQRVLGPFHLLPIVLGGHEFADCRRLAAALAAEVDDQTLLLASSDLSHYYPDAEARELDRWVVDAVSRCDYYGLHQYLEAGLCEACGSGPMLTVMMASSLSGADRAVVAGYATSGDVPPHRRDGVVGYLSALFLPSEGEQLPAEPSEAEARELFKIARQAIQAALQGREFKPVCSGWLERPAAVFVTLHNGEMLRGCIGSVVAKEPLGEAVAKSAVNAALHDRRFEPVTEAELPEIRLEISILGTFRLLSRIEDLVLGRDGLVVELGGARGLLLPQVATERGWDRITFLEQTCRKAGLPADAWRSSDATVFRFPAVKISE